MKVKKTLDKFIECGIIDDWKYRRTFQSYYFKKDGKTCEIGEGNVLYWINNDCLTWGLALHFTKKEK